MATIDSKLPPLPPRPPDGKHCNARMKRQRAYCRKEVRGRCRNHGGKRLEGPMVDLIMGKRANYLPPELKSRFEALNGSAIDALEESVRMQQALETRLWEQLTTGESAAAWQLLNELVPQYEYGDPETRDAIFSRIKQISQGGLKAYGVKKEIQNIHESQRKLTETLTKCRKEAQQTYTQEMWNEMLSSLLRILRQNVPTDVLRVVAVEMQRLTATQETNGINRQRTREIAATTEGNGGGGGAGEDETEAVRAGG